MFTRISISVTTHNLSKITTPNTRHICSGPGIRPDFASEVFRQWAGPSGLGHLVQEFELSKPENR